MKRILIILSLVFITSLTSCVSLESQANIESNKVAGYTLKSKKELLQQKVLNTNNKTVITQP